MGRTSAQNLFQTVKQIKWDNIQDEIDEIKVGVR